MPLQSRHRMILRKVMHVLTTQFRDEFRQELIAALELDAARERNGPIRQRVLYTPIARNQYWQAEMPEPPRLGVRENPQLVLHGEWVFGNDQPVPAQRQAVPDEPVEDVEF